MEHQSCHSPHVLIFPAPFQGHITPLLNLAELLCLANLKVTFLNTTHNHQRLTKYTDIQARFAPYPGFKFETVPDGLPDDHPRTAGQRCLADLLQALASTAKPLFRDILLRATGADKITCLILDGWLGFANDVANEVEIPVIACSNPGASFIWILHCIPQLIEAGAIPFKLVDEDMDQLVKNAPGMDSFLRNRDLPDYCRTQDISACRYLQRHFTGEIQRIKQAHSFIINTFEDLEGPFLSLIHEHLCSKIYPIGPLHALLNHRLGPKETMSENSSSSLWEVDRSCMEWLDQKPDKSVVYVSFGSIATLTKGQLMEFWAGLVQSKKYFLWAIRPNPILGSDLDSPAQDDLLVGTKERGCIVSWAPQEEVLAHRAVGGFFSHSGRTSVLESIVAGVPMLCWPSFSDQLLDSRFISEIWKIGLDMKDTCDRTIVKNMINDLMEGKKDELQKSMSKLSQLAIKSVSEGGSSYSNFNHLIEEIKAMIKIEEH